MIDHTEYQLNTALELLFYGYKGFTALPDQILAERGLARMHHRILYFVGRQPGLSVNQLLGKLGITKQALNGPLRVLIEKGLVEASIAEHDRRVKSLALTEAGCELEHLMSQSQRELMERAFAACGSDAEAGWRKVMQQLAVKA